MLKKLALRTGFLLLVILLLGYTLRNTIDKEKLIEAFSEFSWIKLVLFCLITLLLSVVKGSRFYLILKTGGIKATFLQSLAIFIAGQSTSALPGGELTRGLLLNKELEVDQKRIAAPIILQAYSELMAASIIALFCSILLQIFRLPSTVAIIFLTIVLLVLTSPKILKFLLKIDLKITFLRKFLNATQLAQIDIRDIVFNKGTFLIRTEFLLITALGLLANVIGGVLLFFIAREFSVEINLLKSMFLYSGGLLIQGLAITPGGLGFTEGGMTGILVLYGVDLTRAFSIVLIFRLVTLIFMSIVGSVLLAVLYTLRKVNKAK